MQLDDTLDLRFGLELRPWRDSGITPLWWVLKSSAAYSIEKDWLRIMSRIEDARAYEDSLYIPVRLKTGVAEADVTANAVEQMRRIAAILRGLDLAGAEGGCQIFDLYKFRNCGITLA